MTAPATRKSRDDVIAAAGRLFAANGYHGTSMRDLGRELGLRGSSLYSHVESKEDLLVAVVERGASFFQAAADAAARETGSATARLRALIRGHVDVVLDHLDEAKTFLEEAEALPDDHRNRVVAHRDRYEGAFRETLQSGVATGEFSASVDVKLAAIYLLSVLNALPRWYDDGGELDRDELTDSILVNALGGLHA